MKLGQDSAHPFSSFFHLTGRSLCVRARQLKIKYVKPKASENCCAQRSCVREPRCREALYSPPRPLFSSADALPTTSHRPSRLMPALRSPAPPPPAPAPASPSTTMAVVPDLPPTTHGRPLRLMPALPSAAPFAHLSTTDAGPAPGALCRTLRPMPALTAPASFISHDKDRQRTRRWWSTAIARAFCACLFTHTGWAREQIAERCSDAAIYVLLATGLLVLFPPYLVTYLCPRHRPELHDVRNLGSKGSLHTVDEGLVPRSQ